MASLADYQSNISLRSEDVVKALCRNLFAKTGLTAFGYVVAYPDGSRGLLWTNVKAMHEYLEAGYLKRFLVHQEIKRMEAFYQPSLLYDSQISAKYKRHLTEIFAIQREKYNIGHKFTVATLKRDHIQATTFCTYADNSSIVDLYMNHRDELYKFINEFEDKAAGLIQQIKKNRIVEPWHVPTREELQIFDAYKEDGLVNLKKTEKIICAKLSNGLTAKQIAQQLNRSPRTIESRIDDLRCRFNCQTRTQLAAKFATEFPYLVEK